MEHTDKAFKGATYLYLPAEDVLIEPDNIKASPRIKDTLQIHIIKRFFSHNFIGEELEVIKKLLLLVTIVVHALETMN